MAQAASEKDGAVMLSAEQLRAILEDAAERGAERTLAKLGIDDEKAIEDLREVRALLSAWRVARRVALETVVRVVTLSLVGALAAGAVWQWFNAPRPPSPH